MTKVVDAESLYAFKKDKCLNEKINTLSSKMLWIQTDTFELRPLKGNAVLILQSEMGAVSHCLDAT